MRYLNENEEITLRIKVIEEELILTNKRVISYTERKNKTTYKDIPIDKISYIEHKWKNRNKGLIIGGIITLVFAIIFFSLYAFTPIKIDMGFFITYIFRVEYILIGFVLLIVGIVLLLKGLMQGGYILINDDSWKFNFKTEEAKEFIRKFIQQIYFLAI